MIILNEVTKPVGTVKDERNIYSLGSFNPKEEYFIDIMSVEQSHSAPMRAPVRSIGKIGTPAKFFFSTDLRYISWPRMECVYPQGPIPLSLEIKREGVGFRAFLSFEGYVVYEGLQISRTEKDALSDVAVRAQGANQRFVLPVEVTEAMGESTI